MLSQRLIAESLLFGLAAYVILSVEPVAWKEGDQGWEACQTVRAAHENRSVV